MWPIRRRDVLILVSVWSTGCVVIMVLLGLFFINSGSRAEPDQPEPIATFVIPVSGNTAKTAYVAAAPQAETWQNDVAMVSVSAYWPAATVESLGQPPVWNLRFFSPEHQRLFFALVTADGQTMGQAHLDRLRNPPPLIDPADWVIDSNEAVSIWANQGGGIFIQNYPGSRVEAILRQSPERQAPVWDIIAMSAEKSQVFYLTINATDGTILNQ